MSYEKQLYYKFNCKRKLIKIAKINIDDVAASDILNYGSRKQNHLLK